MKWDAATDFIDKISRSIRAAGSMIRLFVVISALTLILITGAGLLVMTQQKWSASSASSIKSVAVALSASFFLDMLSMEIARFDNTAAEPSLSVKNVLLFLIGSLTGVDPRDPKTFLEDELWATAADRSTLLYSGKATRHTDYPADFTPPPDVFRPNPGKAGQTVPQPNSGAVPPTQTVAPANEPYVFIYHTHNRESFLPELKARGVRDPDLAYDTDINITLVGKRLKEKLDSLGVPTRYSDTDYPSVVKSFQYSKSYAYSAQTVKEAMASNRLAMIFDVHRDSLSRDKTTATIDGVAYAQVYFIVGTKNPNWKKNAEFANRIHKLLEQRMPGISRGVYAKSHNGNAEYNQSLSPNSILMEIGGPYNTLEEMYRTADLLAELIADVYRQAEKVNATASAG